MWLNAKVVPRKESYEEASSQRKQTEAGRYLLQVDRQTKGSFSTFVIAAVTSPGHSYGGYKESGIGREFSLEVLESYTQRKNVTVNLTH